MANAMLLLKNLLYLVRYPKYVFNSLLLEVCLNLLIAFSLICLTLSLVRSNLVPISSRVSPCFIPIPKNKMITSLSLSDKVDKDLLISLCNDSIINSVSAVGESELINTSNNELSSPSWKGASTDTCLPPTHNVSATLVLVTSNSSANSCSLGALSYCCSNLENVLFNLFNEPTWFNGNLTILLCSANA